eukprot:TRINITY_DN8656_c0_g1_i1.p1 TRINITY_DN8656_c0_g1~~TRINITY_DN8656_c0_g1_i1.p1  ORF type:complete len:205 (-),score=26.50 TRINITY_DN8656_c0_g1_i1:67-639(-)
MCIRDSSRSISRIVLLFGGEGKPAKRIGGGKKIATMRPASAFGTQSNVAGISSTFGGAKHSFQDIPAIIPSTSVYVGRFKKKESTLTRESMSPFLQREMLKFGLSLEECQTLDQFINLLANFDPEDSVGLLQESVSIAKEMRNSQTEQFVFIDLPISSSKFAFKFISKNCLLYTSPSPRDLSTSRMPSSA